MGLMEGAGFARSVMGGGQQAFEDSTARRKQNTLAQLAGQYYAGGQQADPAMLGQYAANGGNAGALSDNSDQRLGQDIQAFLANPDPAMYQQFLAPRLKQRFPQVGAGADNFDPSHVEGLQNLSYTLLGGKGQSAQNQLPAEIQVSQYYAKNPDAFNQAKELRQASSNPYGGTVGTDINGQPVWNRVDRRGGGLETVGVGQAPSEPKMPLMQMGMIFQKFGGQITSGFRTKEKNDSLPNSAPNSQHMAGTGMDVVFPPQTKAQGIAFAQAQGYEVRDEGNHVHIELPPSAQRPTVRTPEQQAALTSGATEQAKIDVNTSPANVAATAGAAATTAGATEAAKSAASAQAARDDTAAKKAVGGKRVLELLDGIDALIDQSTGSALGNVADQGAAAVGKSTSGARAIAQLRTRAGQIVAMMPRMEGPQSNYDVQLYTQMAGDLANPMLPRETRKAAAAEIRRLNDKYAAKQPATGGGNVDALLDKYK